MALEEFGAWFTTTKLLDWRAAATAISQLDAYEVLDHPVFDSEIIEEDYTDQLPDNPTESDLLPFIQADLRDGIALLQRAMPDATAVELPEDPEWHLEPMFSYGHALWHMSGDTDSLGVVTETDRKVYFTISVVVRSYMFDVSGWYIYNAIRELSAAGILKAAGAAEWVQ